MRKMPLHAMIEVAILASLALVIDIFIPSLKFGPSISISFAMVPIFIVAFRWGVLAGVVSGFLWEMMQIMFGDAYILTPAQAFVEYGLAFASIGLAGLFSGLIKRNAKQGRKRTALAYVLAGCLIGGAARYFWHFVAGVIFFKKYAIEAGKSPIIFSLTANGITFIFSTLACAIVLILLLSPGMHLITSAKKKETQYPVKQAS